MALAQFSFTKPGSDPGMQKFARDRQIAEALAQQSMMVDQTQMAGGYAIPQTALNPLAKMAQALASRKINERTDAGEREYMRQKNEDVARAIAEAERAGQGREALPAIEAPPEELGGGPGRPALEALAPNPMRTYRALAGVDDPMVKQFGLQAMLAGMTPKEPTKLDVGNEILLMRDGQVVGRILKGATPDAQLRETGAQNRHVTPSGSTVLTNQGAMDRLLISEQGSNQRHMTPSGSAQLGAQVSMRGQNMTDSRSREANEINRQAARTQIINDPVQGPLLVDKGTGATTPARFANGQPVPGEVPAKARANAQDVQMLLDEAAKNITKATGSYAGAGLDQVARVFGAATDGSIAIANLKAIEGALLSKMPRMEGPQSNYDVQAYRQAVGDIGDPTVPNKQKAAAVETVKQIQQKYSSAQGPSAAGATGSFGNLPAMDAIDAELRRREGR